MKKPRASFLEVSFFQRKTLMSGGTNTLSHDPSGLLTVQPTLDFCILIEKFNLIDQAVAEQRYSNLVCALFGKGVTSSNTIELGLENKTCVLQIKNTNK